MVVPETPLSDAIALMATQSKSVLVGYCSQLVGCFTKHDIVQIIASGTDLKTANISEVIHTSLKTLKVSEFPEITCALSLLCQQELDLLPVVDNQGQVVGVITPESICQGLAQEIEKTTDKYEQTPEKCGNFIGCTRCCLDIIEQKLAFEVLQENANRLTFALETTNTIYWEQNLNQERMLFLSLLGKPGEIPEMSYSKFPDVIYRNEREKFASNYSWEIASTGSFEIEHRIFLQGRSPEYKCLLTRGILREDTTGKHAHLVGVSVDITSRVKAKEEQLALEKSEDGFRILAEFISQQVWNAQENDSTISDISEQRECKLAQEALKHSEERFRNLVEASSDWVWEVDENTVYTYVSPKIREILGYKPTKVLGKTPFEFMLPEEAERVIKIFAAIAAAQQPFKCLEDITERKQLEQELRVALKKEKQLSELKSRFVSMTSHEFRRQLSTILSSCELLEHYRHKCTKEKQLTHLHRIQTAVKRMTEMLNNVCNILGTGLGMSIVKKCINIHQGEIFLTSTVGLGTNFTVIISLNNKI